MDEVELNFIADASASGSLTDICRVMRDALDSGLHREEFWRELMSQLLIAH